ncbi:unnamed protein product [Chrysoparadoxa australica]
MDSRDDQPVGATGAFQERNAVSYTVLGNVFRVDPRYKDLKAIGKGSYGIVCSAYDQKQAKKVAIKKITPMAHHAVDAKHVLREIRLMRFLGVHPNIISLEDVFVREFDDELYIVMELLDSDLHRIIQSSQSLSDAHHRYFMYQLLRGVQFLHQYRVIHRDLKPGNLLVTKNCQLRITDFGLARCRPQGKGAHPDEEVDDPMTEHVVTRWYRPPELMLCPDGMYDYAVDLWSCGCIFAELLGRTPLFPGTNFVDQLTQIFEVLGSPAPEEVAHIRNSQARKFLDSMSGNVKQPHQMRFPDASEAAVSLLDGLLVFDPPQRLTVAEALEHHYFDPLRNSEGHPDPPVAPGFEFDFESEPLARLQLKSLILEEVDTFRRESRRRESRGSSRAGGSAGSGSGAGASGSSRRRTKTRSSGSSRRHAAAHDSSRLHGYQSNKAGTREAAATVKAGAGRYQASFTSSSPMTASGEVMAEGLPTDDSNMMPPQDTSPPMPPSPHRASPRMPTGATVASSIRHVEARRRAIEDESMEYDPMSESPAGRVGLPQHPRERERRHQSRGGRGMGVDSDVGPQSIDEQGQRGDMYVGEINDRMSSLMNNSSRSTTRGSSSTSKKRNPGGSSVKKRTTEAKSPKFSQMSWQRKRPTGTGTGTGTDLPRQHHRTAKG